MAILVIEFVQEDAQIYANVASVPVQIYGIYLITMYLLFEIIAKNSIKYHSYPEF